MIPFIDLLMVTISFLLITAVWVTHSRIQADAQVPGSHGEIITNPEPQLHVYVEPGRFTLTWKQERTTLSEITVERQPGARAHPALQKAIVEQYASRGQHVDPVDKGFDRAVLHTPDAMPFGDMVGVMDALYSAKREVRFNGQPEKVPAFRVALAR